MKQLYDFLFNDYTFNIFLKLPSYLPFLTILLIVAFILRKAHTNEKSQFQIFDLIEDKKTGKGSLEKVGLLTAMLTLTWWFIELTVTGKAGAPESLVYGGLMGAQKVANSWLATKSLTPSSSTSSTSSTTTSIINVPDNEKDSNEPEEDKK